MSDALAVGDFDFNVIFNVSDAHGEEFETTSLPVRGVVVDDLQFDPPQAVFGVCSVGDTVAQDVVLRSRTKNSFAIESIELPASGVSAVSLTSGYASSHSIAIRQQASNLGQNMTQINFRVQTASRKSRRLPLELTYYGK